MNIFTNVPIIIMQSRVVSDVKMRECRFQLITSSWFNSIKYLKDRYFYFSKILGHKSITYRTSSHCQCKFSSLNDKMNLMSSLIKK